VVINASSSACHAAVSNGDQQAPHTWNVLELPKPVNPSDVASSSSSSSAAAESNKKLASASTKMAKVPSSPSTAASSSSPAAEKKPDTVNKTAISKPVAGAAAVTAAPSATAAAALKQQSGPAAYVEVAYVPAHGNGAYLDAEFFRRVRAKYYVLSSVEPSEHVLNALADAKEQFWTSAEDRAAAVNLITTYETDVLRNWFVQNEERLARLHIDVMPPACVNEITMDENPATTCRALKLEL
jgi:hypothetical protein